MNVDDFKVGDRVRRAFDDPHPRGLETGTVEAVGKGSVTVRWKRNSSKLYDYGPNTINSDVELTLIPNLNGLDRMLELVP